MGITDKIKDFIAPPEEEELELSKDEAEQLSAYEHPQDSTISNITSNTNIVLFEPRNFDETAEIGRHIKQNRACCINLHRMPTQYRQRVIDFLSGIIFGVDGSIKKLGKNVILCSPKKLQVAGEINLNPQEDSEEEEIY